MFHAIQNLDRNKDTAKEKSDKGNSAVIVDRPDYLHKMEKLLNKVQKSEKINLKNDGIFSFPVNQEKQLNNVFQNSFVPNSIFEETRRSPRQEQLRLGQI